NSIPRPPNAFILFRSHVWKVLKEKQDEGSQKINLADVSKNVGGMWAKLPKEEQEKWKQEALSVKAQHAARFPGYHYAPTLKK
ncbi:HMG-box, partial [Dendrothele bispora CBS 962.96]